MLLLLLPSAAVDIWHTAAAVSAGMQLLATDVSAVAVVTLAVAVVGCTWPRLIFVVASSVVAVAVWLLLWEKHVVVVAVAVVVSEAVAVVQEYIEKKKLVSGRHLDVFQLSPQPEQP